jgi:hypothetical protein
MYSIKDFTLGLFVTLFGVAILLLVNVVSNIFIILLCFIFAIIIGIFGMCLVAYGIGG